MTQDDEYTKSEWNQSRAMQGRLNALFTNAHIARMERDWDAWLTTLYGLLTESSSVITDDEEQSIWEAVEHAENGVGTLAEERAVHKRFTEAEILIRNTLDDHDMMIEHKEDLGIPGDT